MSLLNECATKINLSPMTAFVSGHLSRECNFRSPLYFFDSRGETKPSVCIFQINDFKLSIMDIFRTLMCGKITTPIIPVKNFFQGWLR